MCVCHMRRRIHMGLCEVRAHTHSKHRAHTCGIEG